MQSEKGISVLQDSLIAGRFSNIFFQDDNCTPHKAETVSTYPHQKGIEVMRWPAQSPNLNPIDNARAS